MTLPNRQILKIQTPDSDLNRFQDALLSVVNPILKNLGINAVWTNVSGPAGPYFQNSWANVSATSVPVGFYQDWLGTIHLRGIMSGGSLSKSAFVLPQSVRPQYSMTFAVDSNGAYGAVVVDNLGNVTPTVGATTNVSLNGITFDTRN